MGTSTVAVFIRPPKEDMPCAHDILFPIEGDVIVIKALFVQPWHMGNWSSCQSTSYLLLDNILLLPVSTTLLETFNITMMVGGAAELTGWVGQLN